MSSTLVIPIQVQAVCVGEDDALNGNIFSGPTLDFTALPYGSKKGVNVSETVVTRPFQGNTMMPCGIHLHWSLPDGFLQAQVAESRLRFTPVPNRWLIYRVQTDGPPDAPAQTRAWIVLSDALDAESSSSSSTVLPWPRATEPKQRPFRMLGQRVPLENLPVPPGATLEGNLTPATLGDPVFLTYYPNAKGVYGFCDESVAEVANGHFFYAVLGWYDTPGQDPLYGLSGGELQRKLESLRLTVSPSGTPEKTERSVFHGAVEGLDWQRSRTYYPEGASTISGVRLGIGNNGAEALSALVTDIARQQGISINEDTLTGLQLSLADTDAPFKKKQQLQEARFNAIEGEKEWTIAALPAQENDKVPILPDTLSRQLAELNSLQKKQAAALRRKQSLQARVFSDWYKYMVVSYSDQSEEFIKTYGDGFRAQIMEYIKTLQESEAFKSLFNAPAGYDGPIAALVTAIRTQIDTLKLTPFYKLDIRHGRRFHIPRDPVVLLMGPEFAPHQTPFSPGYTDLYLCRCDTEVVKRLMVRTGTGPGNKPVELVFQELLPLPSLPVPDSALFSALIREMAALSPAFVPRLAALAKTSKATTPDGLAATPYERLLADALSYRRQHGLFPDTVTFTGTAPLAACIQSGVAPWTPMLLEWEAAYYPDNGISGNAPLSADTLRTHYHTSSDTFDLVRKAPPSSTPSYVEGRVALSGHAFGVFSDIVLRKFGDNPDIRKLMNAMGNVGTLSQSLDFFHDRLAHVRPTLQLRIEDPGRNLPRSYREFSNELVPSLVGKQNLAAPMYLNENGFFSLRGGSFKISKLRLIDRFGRFKTVVTHTPVYASSLADSSDATRAVASPRFNLPLRLQWQWQPVSDKFPDDAGRCSPVLGFVVPQFLDRSIMLISADGTLLGSLGLGANDTIVWQSFIPGKPNAAIEEVVTLPFLRQWALMLRQSPQLLAEMLTCFRRTLLKITSGSDAVSALYFTGHPFALCYGSATLEAGALFPIHQSLSTLKRDMEQYARNPVIALQRTTLGTESLSVPFEMGGMQSNDGLAGFFTVTGTDSGRTFSPFYSLVANETDVSKPSKGSQSLVPDQPENYLLLMDPRLSIHFATGVLPLTSVTLDTVWTAPVANAALRTLIAPVLTPASGIHLPLSPNGTRQYRWVAGDQSRADVAFIGEKESNQYTPLVIREGWLENRGKAET